MPAQGRERTEYLTCMRDCYYGNHCDGVSNFRQESPRLSRQQLLEFLVHEKLVRRSCFPLNKTMHVMLKFQLESHVMMISNVSLV